MYLLIYLCIFWFLAFYGAPIALFTIAFAVFFLVAYLLQWVNRFGFFHFGFFFTSFTLIAGSLFLSMPFLRRRCITRYVFEPFQKHLPKISQTEAEALESGDCGWEKDIFSAKPKWREIKKYTLTKLTAEEQAFIQIQVKHLCSLLNERDIIQHGDLPRVVWDWIKTEKFFGLHIPKEYGGRGFSAYAHSEIITQIATQSITAAVTVMVPNALGPAELLMRYGTDLQKNYYLPRLATGEEIPCFALTSAWAGSDAGSITDEGVVCEGVFEDQKTLGIRISWSKRYITLAPVATVLGLAFKLFDPDGLLDPKNGDRGALGITLALIPTDHPGVQTGRRHLAMGIPFQNGPTQGHDVFIPLDWVIGGVPYIGQGWRMLMECLAGGRGISLPALGAATSQVAYMGASAYGTVRRQFKTALLQFEGIQAALSHIAGMNYLSQAVRHVTASALDHDIEPPVLTAIAKYHLTEFARISLNHAMDIHAGKAVMTGPSNYLSFLYMGVPVAITVEGSNILTRNLIIFGQGAIRSHPYLYKEVKALTQSDPQAGLIAFDRLLFQHMGHVISTKLRLMIYTIGLLGRPLLRRYAWPTAYRQDITRLSCAFALLSDIAFLLLGGQLKTKERLSARLGDALSYLYMSLCVFKVYEDRLQEKTATSKEVLYVRWCLDFCLYQTESALHDFLGAFEFRGVAFLLKILLFPAGRIHPKPSDRLEKELAQSADTPDTLWMFLTHNCYRGENLGFLDQVFKQHEAVKPMLSKLFRVAKEYKIPQENGLRRMIQAAYEKNALLRQEFEALSDYDRQVERLIAVDDFDADLNNG